MEIVTETPWSRIMAQKSVYREFLVNVDDGSPMGCVLLETIGSFRNDFNKRAKMTQRNPSPIFSCFRMREKRREPEVPEDRVPVIESLDCPARITLEELAITHFVKTGTLQNACSTRPRVVPSLGKSDRMHIVKLMNNLVKGPKKNDDKKAVVLLKKND